MDDYDDLFYALYLSENEMDDILRGTDDITLNGKRPDSHYSWDDVHDYDPGGDYFPFYDRDWEPEPSYIL